MKTARMKHILLFVLQLPTQSQNSLLSEHRTRFALHQPVTAAMARVRIILCFKKWTSAPASIHLSAYSFITAS